MKVSLKLSILIIVAFISLCIVGYTGYYYLQRSNADISMMYTDRLIPAQLINENRSLINRVNAAVLELMLTTDEKQSKS